MKKALNDVKSFTTIIFSVSFFVFTFMRIISGEQFYSIFQIIIAFYFGTQYQKNVEKKEGNINEFKN